MTNAHATGHAAANRPAGLVFAVLLCTSPTIAQGGSDALPPQPQPTTATDPVQPGVPAQDPLVPIHTAEPDLGVPYGIWGAGPGYKASFHDGATFVPMLGRDYPHNQPLSWRTVSAQVGQVELVSQPPRLAYDGLRAWFDLGGLVEAYDLRDDGLEQTFVLTERPAAAGDLVIRGAVESALVAHDVAPAHQALSFRDDAGREIVQYGAATAIDAAGRTQPMTTALEHGEVVLRLDAAWLAAAEFPVVVDPVFIGLAQILGSTRDEVDVVRDSESSDNGVWLAYSVWFSATDRDLYVRRFNDDTNTGPLAFTDVTSTWSTQRARCAYVAGADRAIIVFDRYFPTLQSNALRFHAHDRTDLSSNSNYTAIPASNNAWRGDVGGTDFNSSGPTAVVVWQQEPNAGPFGNTSSSDIYGCLVDVASETVGTPFAVASSGFGDHERPSVNQTANGLADDSWRVAYQTLSTLVIGGSDDWDVYVRKIDLNGQVSAATEINGASSDHKFAPIIEGNGSRYLVAFVTSPQVPGSVPQGINGHQIRVTRLDWSNSSGSGTEPWGTVILQANSDPRLELGGLGFDRRDDSHWALMFRSNVSEILYLRTVGYRGEQVQAETVVDPAGSDTSVIGGVSFDETGDRFVLGYAINGQITYVTLALFLYPSVAPAFASGISCSPATIAWVGSQQIGAEFPYVRVYNAPANALHVLALATAPASAILSGIPPFENGCWLLIANTGNEFLGLFGVEIGSSVFWYVKLPEFLTPDTYYFQGFHTSGPNFTLQTTQRLTVPVVK